MTSTHDIVVAIYDTHAEAEETVRELQKSGFDMTKLSIVAKNPHAEEHVWASTQQVTALCIGARQVLFGAVCGVSSPAQLFLHFQVLVRCW